MWKILKMLICAQLFSLFGKIAIALHRRPYLNSESQLYEFGSNDRKWAAACSGSSALKYTSFML
jgi:hypothetical protein